MIGGGLTTVLNARLNRKSNKLDFTGKLVAFWQEQAGDLMTRVETLEIQVKQLLKAKCDRPDCDKRI